VPIVTLTDLVIKHLKPVAGRQVTYLDRSLKGFGVRVGSKGITYILIYGPNRTRVKLGKVGIVKLADARAKARSILAERQLGIHQPKGHETYAEAVEKFLEGCRTKNKPRTLHDYTRLLNRHGFGAERLSDIAPRDVQKKLDHLADTPSEQAHAQAVLRIFFSYCVRRHLLDHSPMARIDRPRKAESRSRILSDEELKKVWRASAGAFGQIVRLCILTGQRRSEIAQLTAEMVEDDCIRLPKSLTKNNREHLFPIGKLAREIIAALPKTGFLFPARKTWRKGGTVYNAWNKDKPRLDTASGVTGWVLHDLRRTLVSSWAALGVRIEVTEKYINHISGTHGGIVGIYQRHTFLLEMRAAVEKWEAHLSKLLSTP
jgi:integrase